MVSSSVENIYFSSLRIAYSLSKISFSLLSRYLIKDYFLKSLMYFNFSSSVSDILFVWKTFFLDFYCLSFSANLFERSLIALASLSSSISFKINLFMSKNNLTISIKRDREPYLIPNSGLEIAPE